MPPEPPLNMPESMPAMSVPLASGTLAAALGIASFRRFAFCKHAPHFC